MSAFKVFKKEIKRPSVGEILKKARLKKGIDLAQVESETKIRIRYIEAIEEDSSGGLPEGPYISGFLKKYAQYLDVPLNKIDKLYKQEVGAKKSLDKKMFLGRKEFKRSRIYITPAILASSFLALVIIGVVGYIVYQILGFTGVPYLLVKSPSNGIVSLEESITVEGKTQKDVSLYMNGQLLALDTEGSFKQEVRLKTGSNTINIVAVNKGGKKTEKNLIILYQIPNQNGGQEVTMDAQRPKE